MDFNHVREGDLVKCTARIEVENFRFPESGYLDVFVYHPLSSNSINSQGFFQQMYISELTMEYTSQNVSPFIVRRDIDYTTTESLNIKLGDSVLDQVKQALIYQPYIAPESFITVPFAAYNATYAGTNYGWVLKVSYTYYLALLSRLNDVYIQRLGSDYPEYVEDVAVFVAGSNYFLKVVLPDGYNPVPGDALMYRSTPTGNPQTITIREYREKWQTSILTSEVDRLGTVLAKQIHSIYPTPIKGMEGVCEGLVWPRTALLFQLKNEAHQFIPMRTTIDFNSNQSKVFGLQKKRNVITDYE